ncbi:hypothetical protein H310_01849 [Aphanomyces invadans]|uniref:Uncharacterized protein n=1 Tax=Aphanomyces invadans TaxID=157072 RepID=A0A024ULW4_9STRA|nr:hypothetical protein H310_01849 [Aphanomyces invadans]ETW07294.1 hypothetical protein H310_01849 [Aphanomyces invadans]|eukprot:XP_008863387.1 hypothetical protein H310_01849 [Aphanomyces invadans]
MADRFEILEETSHTPEKTTPERKPTHDNEDHELNELVEELSVETKDVKKASEAKEAGNELFKAGRYLDAFDLYTKALRLCPSEDEYAYNKAVYFSNRAACLLHLGRPEESIEDCTMAITHSPKYVKALMRRSQAYEKMDKMDEALQDVKTVLEIDPTVPSAIDAEKRLSAVVAERQEKMKAEMLDKLKGFGNTILGKFGLSTDNFQMVQDPATGSYNINFTQNPAKP